jgi:hypothetical protein
VPPFIDPVDVLMKMDLFPYQYPRQRWISEGRTLASWFEDIDTLSVQQLNPFAASKGSSSAFRAKPSQNELQGHTPVSIEVIA